MSAFVFVSLNCWMNVHLDHVARKGNEHQLHDQQLANRDKGAVLQQSFTITCTNYNHDVINQQITMVTQLNNYLTSTTYTFQVSALLLICILRLA